MNIRRIYTEESTVLNTDSFDRERFAQLVELSPRLDEQVYNLAKDNKQFIALAGDIWSSLYKAKPTLKEIEEGKTLQNPINYEFLKKIMEDENFSAMRKTTMLDDFSSAIGTIRLSEKVQEWISEQKTQEEIKNLMEELLRKQKELEKQQEKQQKAQEKKEQADQQGIEMIQKKTNTSLKKEQKKTEKLQNELLAIQQQLQQQFQQAMQGPEGQSFSKAIEQASQETINAKKDLQNLLAGGAGSGVGEMKKIPLRHQIALAEELRKHPKMKEIADWAGKFKAIARKKQKAKFTESLDRSGMTLGSDVERLLPQELGMLTKESTRLDFLRRFAEHQTMMYSPKGKETLGKGTIVLCLDQSGSMLKVETQAKGFILALAMIAKKQRRDFAVVTFSNKVNRSMFFEKGNITAQELVELALRFDGGGTRYIPPLMTSKEIIEKNKRFKKADIIFVTDGDPSDHHYVAQKLDWFHEFKHRFQVNVAALLIGDSVQEQYVKFFSDKVIHAADFVDEKAHEILTI